MKPNKLSIMYIQDLLKYKIKLEIFDELNNLYVKDDINYNQKLFKKIILKKVDSKLKDIEFMKSKAEFEYKDYHCKARIWDNHYGSRCRYSSVQNQDYCKHHMNMLINNNNKLRFGNCDEDKPLRNEKGNLIPWFTKDKILMINDIIQSDTNNVLFPLIRKYREITPRF